jgi:hypothetical protein
LTSLCLFSSSFQSIPPKHQGCLLYIASVYSFTT